MTHEVYGVPDRNRTCNPQLRRLVLYPVELRALLKPGKPGRGGEIRTPDILLPKQARYQATLHPEARHYTCLAKKNQIYSRDFCVICGIANIR